LKKEHSGIIPGGEMVTWGVCLMYIQHYIRVISLGRDYSKEYKMHLDRGRIPKENASRRSSPKRRMAICH
jgi:hypothetical protein